MGWTKYGRCDKLLCVVLFIVFYYIYPCPFRNIYVTFTNIHVIFMLGDCAYVCMYVNLSARTKPAL